MTLLFLTMVVSVASPPASLEASFETLVRPILVEHCQKCHGPAKQNGGLRLDSRKRLISGGDSGAAFVAGRPAESLLVKAVQRHPDVSAMPPDRPLPKDSVRALEDWIRNGAVWPETKSAAVGLGDVTAILTAAKTHWAFQPKKKSAAPRTSQKDWAATPIDAFLLSRMESAGLEPSRDAERATLIRRAYFDLLGLPPTPEDCDSFLSDPDATPLAFAKVVDRLLASPHYGERWGRHWLDVARYADTKGYVFQEERRYPFSYTYRDWVVGAFNEDLPYDRFVMEQIAADKLKRNDNRSLAAMGFLTVGRRFLQDGNEIADDRIDVVTRGLLGLTVSCARCHDHKYDPVSMADYYGLYGVFASSEEPKDLPILASSDASRQRAEFDSAMKVKALALESFLNEQHGATERRLITDAEKFLRLNLAASGKTPKGGLSEAAKQQGLSVGAVRKWNERWSLLVADASKRNDPAVAAWALLANIPEKDFAASAPIRLKKFALEDPQLKSSPLKSLIENPPKEKSALPKVYSQFVVEATRSPRAAEEFPSLFGPSGAFRIPRAEVQQFFDRKQREQAKSLERSIEELKVKHPGAEVRAMVMVDRPQPIEPHIFLRGNPGRPGPQVSRAFPAMLTGGVRKPFHDGSGRRELAASIVDAENPLTSRVIVNRIWKWRFGKGLAPSPSDFGLRSDPPSHPELLDDLAIRLVSDGWSLKNLHRLMLQSHAYRLSSDSTEAQSAGDPDNRLLTHFPRLRLEWEALRDAALATGGSLSQAIGGRPTPLFEDPMPRRRTLYGFIDRQNLDAAFRTFDFATPDATSAQRFVTTVPQQGLFLLNSKFLLAQAERFAAGTQSRRDDDPRLRVQRMFRQAFSRTPESVEVDRAVAYLVAQPDWTANPNAAWTRFAQCLMMSNEFAFVD